MVILVSLFWVIFGIIYILYELYKEEHETLTWATAGFIVITPLISGIALVFCMFEDNQLGEVVNGIITATGLLFDFGLYAHSILIPNAKRKKRLKKLFEFLNIEYRDEFSKEEIVITAQEYLKAKADEFVDCYETEQFYIDYITLYGTETQKKRLIELMIIKSDYINDTMNQYNKKKVLLKGFFLYSVSGNYYTVDDRNNQKARLCQTLGVKYFSAHDVHWDYHLTLDILEKEGLIHFPEELHSPDYRKYREYIQAPR